MELIKCYLHRNNVLKWCLRQSDDRRPTLARHQRLLWRLLLERRPAQECVWNNTAGLESVCNVVRANISQLQICLNGALPVERSWHSFSNVN